MTDQTSTALTSPQLFCRCADPAARADYWDEFVQRFNPVLVRSVAITWRRYGPGGWLPSEIAEDLLQDIYTNILKNDARLLRNFQGESEAEAQAYLAHTAIYQTINYLRAKAAQKRAAEEISLQTLLAEAGEASLFPHPAPPGKGLSEWEFISTLRHLFQGKHADRDILLMLLYARDGYSPAEITRLNVCDLKETSIANILAQMKSTLKKYLAEKS